MLTRAAYVMGDEKEPNTKLKGFLPYHQHQISSQTHWFWSVTLNLLTRFFYITKYRWCLFGRASEQLRSLPQDAENSRIVHLPFTRKEMSTVLEFWSILLIFRVEPKEIFSPIRKTRRSVAIQISLSDLRESVRIG